MKLKVITGLMFTLFLVGMLTFAFNIQTVKAIGTIYIRSDGSIDPPTAPIQRDGDLYTFTDNINESIRVEKSNIIVDGNGYTLQGTREYYGMLISGRTSVTIKNMEIKVFIYGMVIDSSSYINISGNNVTNCTYGIGLCLSSNCVLRNNAMTGNKYNFGILGWVADEPSHFMHDVDTSNTVDGRPILYLVNKQNLIIDPQTYPNIGYLALVNSANITVQHLNMKSNHEGILLAYTKNSLIHNVVTTKNTYGIEMISSSNNSISGNNITNNKENAEGIYLGYSSDYNRISGNNITDNFNGIELCVCSYNSIFGNNITNNWRWGVELGWSSNNSITGNNITDNSYGVGLDYSSDYNSISGNNITANKYYGIYLTDSSNNNKFYHNNFINNTRQVYSGGLMNIWDDDYPSGGNYWSNYTGVDLYSGPYQNETGSDGIGDTPHIIDANNRDRYPLMNPWSPPSYTLTIHSSPTGITFTLDGNPKTTPYTEWLLEGSYTLVMPETHNGYVWSHWLEDGDTNRIKAVTLNTNITLTAVFTLDITPPTISIISPQNKTYLVNDVPLTFTVSESTSWIGYSLDGQMNVTISGNTTIVGLSDGAHTITVYANDTAGNMGYSNTVYFTVDTVSPNIEILSPENKTYTTSSVSLSFTVDEATSWIGYSLDGQANVTITGNTTLSGLSEGSHSLIVYANDTAGNTGTSGIIYFSIETKKAEPFPTLIVAAIVIIAVVGAALLIYFARVKKTTEKVK